MAIITIIIISFIIRHPVLDWNNQPWTPDHGDMMSLANQKLNPDDMFVAALGLTADLDELCNEYQLDTVWR